MIGGSIALAFIAGLLSILSPCVLPLLPIVLGSAATAHRLGPLALAAGLSLSFVVIGLFVATFGFALGLDGDLFRKIAAILLLVLGLVLIVPRLQEAFTVAAAPISAMAERGLGGSLGSGAYGQFGIGLLLGAVWSPCVGPTLGAASLLAAQGRNLAEVALTMAVFGLGAALPLVIMGTLSREALMRMRGRMFNAGKGGKMALGALLSVVGLLILTGADKSLEATLVAISPEWLTRLTTSY